MAFHRDRDFFERNFYSNGSVTVSNDRFIVGSTTYAMNGVTSVKRGQTDPSRMWPIILCLVGLYVLFQGSMMTFLAGVAMVAIGVLWFKAIKPEYMVFLNSSSGESQALASKDVKYIDQVIAALNEAIIHRG